MSILYAAGERYNLASRGVLSLTAGTADPLYPLSNLAIGRPSKPFRFSSKLAQERVVIDTCETPNPSFEDWALSSVPDGWVDDSVGGAVSETTVGAEVHSGTSAAKFVGGPGAAGIHVDVIVRAGEKRRLAVWLHGGGVGQAIAVNVKNLVTGRFLDGFGLWGATVADVFTRTSASYGESVQEYVVESHERCGADTVTLRFSIYVTAGATSFVDDFTDCAAVDVAAFIGMRNIEDRCTIEWEHSAAGVTYTDALIAGNHTLGWDPDERPNAYLRRPATVTDKRFQRFTFENDTVIPTLPRELGELVLCQVSELARGPDWGMEMSESENDLAHEAANGDLQVYSTGSRARRSLRMELKFPEMSSGAALATMRDNRNDLWRRARGRALPILIVPDSGEANIVMLMRATSEWSVRREFNVYTDNDLLLTELPFVSPAR